LLAFMAGGALLVAALTAWSFLGMDAAHPPTSPRACTPQLPHLTEPFWQADDSHTRPFREADLLKT